MVDAENISERVGKLREELLRDDNVLLAYVFGSYAHGFTTPLSDVDVAVLLKDNSLGKLSDLLGRLAKALNVNEDFLDLVDLARASLRLKYNVVERGFKLVDKGDFEEKLKEGLVNNYPEARRLLDSVYEECVGTLNCKVNRSF
jgi:predicted nucleotidyltransferase